MHQGEKSKLASNIAWGYYAIAFAIALLALVPRFGFDRLDPGAYLWAEDGTVFLNEAREMGAAAIFKPYAGYLHFYPRIYTLFAQLFSFVEQPVVLMFGWLISYLLMMYAVARVAAKTDRSRLVLAMLVGLTSLQPHYVEVFFNITNSQWMIGGALAIFALADIEIPNLQKKIRGVLLVPMALTGPFSITLSPALVLRLLLKKDWAAQKFTYIPIFSGAIIQACVLLTSTRVAGPTNADPELWFFAFSKLVLFGANDFLVLLLAVSIWFILGFLIRKLSRDLSFAELLTHPAVLMLFTAAIMFLAAIYAKKYDPTDVVALGGGNRYTWVPYTLVLLAGFLLTYGRKLLRVVMTLLAVILCIAEFHKFSTHDLQFEAFEKLSQVEQVYIPLNPLWNSFPAWHILAGPRDAKVPPVNTVELNLKEFAVARASASYRGKNLELAYKGTAEMTFSRKVSCPDSKFAGLDVYMTRDKPAWTRLFWDENGQFTNEVSLPRWYPAGKVKAQYAFAIPPDGVNLRIIPLRIEVDDAHFEGHITIEKIELHCL